VNVEQKSFNGWKGESFPGAFQKKKLGLELARQETFIVGIHSPYFDAIQVYGITLTRRTLKEGSPANLGEDSLGLAKNPLICPLIRGDWRFVTLREAIVSGFRKKGRASERGNLQVGNVVFPRRRLI